MADIERISSPTVEEYAEAAEINLERTPYQRELDSPARFLGFQKLGVEIAVVRRQGRMASVAHLLPSSCESSGGEISWVYMFQLASRQDAAGAGAILVKRIMEWYPAILGIGITPDAERMYKAFQWKHFGDIWRAVHPLHLDRMMEDYANHGKHMTKPWQWKLLRTCAGAYNAGTALIEKALSVGIDCERWKPSAEASKAAVVADYLPMYRAGMVIAADVGGIGRVGNQPGADAGSLRQHAAIWREMRRGGVKFCEMLAHSPEFRARAIRLGYYPARLPVWYWDRHHRMEPALELLRSGRISFWETDKVV